MTTLIFTQSYTLVQPMPDESGNVVSTVFHVGDHVTDDTTIAALLAAGAPVTFIVDDFGQAAFKNVSDNVRLTVASVAGSTIAGNILVANDVGGTVSEGPVAGNKVLTSTIVNPDVGSNLIDMDVTVGFSALASGGSVTILNNLVNIKRYKIHSLKLNSNGTNFSGGGGNRLGQITDGTTVYTVIPAASMQTLANARWGDTAIPFPAAAASNTTTALGADLVFSYSGGTTDYTAGSLTISLTLQRVA